MHKGWGCKCPDCIAAEDQTGLEPLTKEDRAKGWKSPKERDADLAAGYVSATDGWVVAKPGLVIPRDRTN